MTNIFSDFLSERKSLWIKSKKKTALNEAEIATVLQEAESRFALENWLPDAAKRASQLSMVSHPSKFSHPSARTSTVIAKCRQSNDGYLRSGNVNYGLDVFGTAAAMDVYKFINLQMADGRTVLEHLDEDSEQIKKLMDIPTAEYPFLKENLIKIKKIDTDQKTDQRVKQIYFPVDDTYHLLSVLTPSGILVQLKKIVDEMKFGEEAKAARECRKKTAHHPAGYDELFDLTVTAYGGTKPQNISVLNSQNGGKAYLLASVPPSIEQRSIRLPQKDFFKNSLSFYQFKKSFLVLKDLSQSPINNVNIRNGIHKTITFLIDQILERAFLLRQSAERGWSSADYYSSLPQAQKIWLDDFYLAEREDENGWMADISSKMARWIVQGFEHYLKENSVKLGNNEFIEIKKIAKDAVSNDQRYFA